MGLLSIAGNLVNGAESGLAKASGAAWNAVGQPIYNAVDNAVTGYHAPVVDTSAAGEATRTAAAQAAAAAGTGAGATTTGGTTATATLTPSQVAAINAGYDQVLGNYDTQIGDIPGEIGDATSLVNSQYDSQGKSIATAYGIGNDNLAASRTQLGTDTSRSIQKLAQGIRDSFNSYSTMIGADGAGDSSANGQLSYALQKAEAQNRTDIYNNEGDNMTKLNLSQSSLDANHADQLQKLDAWKSQQVISIGQQFKAEQASLEAAKAGASQQKLLALANANSDLVNQAVAALSGVTAQHQQATAAIQAAISNAAAPTDSSTLATDSPALTASPGVQLPTFTDASGATSDPNASFATVPYTSKLLQTV